MVLKAVCRQTDAEMQFQRCCLELVDLCFRNHDLDLRNRNFRKCLIVTHWKQLVVLVYFRSTTCLALIGYLNNFELVTFFPSNFTMSVHKVHSIVHFLILLIASGKTKSRVGGGRNTKIRTWASSEVWHPGNTTNAEVGIISSTILVHSVQHKTCEWFDNQVDYSHAEYVG